LKSSQLIRWFHDHGVTDIYKDIQYIHTFFGWDSPSSDTQQIAVDGAFAQTLQTFFEELMEVMPMTAMMNVGMELYQNGNPAAVALLQRFREPAMAEAWTRLKLVPEAQELSDALVQGGVALEIFVIIVEAFFGWA